MMYPGPGTVVPSGRRVAPADPPTSVKMFRMSERTPETSATHQYSLRLARPENVAYFLKNLATASGREAPYNGAQGGTGPDTEPG
ncbi:hypothetical protein GCM10009825_01750 [Arthrobacter humicola]|uniref:Uncharacterized protein n=1 Tax=Arthrobacter humicola TaxID=409291 RepID=A0ABN2YFZ8_9MICC